MKIFVPISPVSTYKDPGRNYSSINPFLTNVYNWQHAKRVLMYCIIGNNCQILSTESQNLQCINNTTELAFTVPVHDTEISCQSPNKTITDNLWEYTLISPLLLMSDDKFNIQMRQNNYHNKKQQTLHVQSRKFNFRVLK